VQCERKGLGLYDGHLSLGPHGGPADAASASFVMRTDVVSRAGCHANPGLGRSICEGVERGHQIKSGARFAKARRRGSRST
jgi:hypothetical protein